MKRITLGWFLVDVACSLLLAVGLAVVAAGANYA